VVTVYWGAGVSEGEAREALRSFDKLRTQGRLPQGVEVEVVYGGQPLYAYIVSIE